MVFPNYMYVYMCTVKYVCSVACSGACWPMEYCPIKVGVVMGVAELCENLLT